MVARSILIQKHQVVNQAFKLYDKGYNPEQIARILDRPQTRVQGWLCRRRKMENMMRLEGIC